jgi:hypothetical protein
MISRALANEGDIPAAAEKKKPLPIGRLEEIAKEGLS